MIMPRASAKTCQIKWESEVKPDGQFDRLSVVRDLVLEFLAGIEFCCDEKSWIYVVMWISKVHFQMLISKALWLSSLVPSFQVQLMFLVLLAQSQPFVQLRLMLWGYKRWNTSRQLEKTRYNGDIQRTLAVWTVPLSVYWCTMCVLGWSSVKHKKRTTLIIFHLWSSVLIFIKVHRNKRIDILKRHIFTAILDFAAFLVKVLLSLGAQSASVQLHLKGNQRQMKQRPTLTYSQQLQRLQAPKEQFYSHNGRSSFFTQLQGLKLKCNILMAHNLVIHFDKQVF